MSDSTVSAPWNPGPLPAPRPTAATTLPIRVEFARQISQWRVRVVLIVLGTLPIVIRLAFLIGGGSVSTEGRTDLAAFAQASGTTFAAFVIVVTGGFLMTLVVALLFGDMIAGEASRSTLKYLLTIPVPRYRLLLVKVLVSASVLALGILVLTGMSLLVGVLSYGPGGLVLVDGPQLGLGDSLLRIAAASTLVGVHLMWAASLGTLFTVVSDAPLAAAGGVVITSIVSSILERIDDLGDLRFWLPTYNTDAFRQFFAGRTDFEPIANSVLSCLIYALVFGIAAAWWFRRKNITS